MYFVYALVDPQTRRKRYIGIIDNLERRYKAHLACIEKGTEKTRWIEKLLARGLKPRLEIVETIRGNKATALEREKYWIGIYLAQGADLLNVQHGIASSRIIPPPRIPDKPVRRAAACFNEGHEIYLCTTWAERFCGVDFPGTRFLHIAERYKLSKRVCDNTTYYRLTELQNFVPWLHSKYPELEKLAQGDRIDMKDIQVYLKEYLPHNRKAF